MCLYFPGWSAGAHLSGRVRVADPRGRRDGTGAPHQDDPGIQAFNTFKGKWCNG
ncbi:hypothetical protein DPMN_101855 [Dreissena polymorpha]|uniref:Uncharacterized protein n=1 Tax=Dreissena polymorpha TaxID=45954 RepID=A0A9D4R8M4_DREPO|nr:hypothetical protein DPMN_101855 [Dreissena polymorpha]